MNPKPKKERKARIIPRQFSDLHETVYFDYPEHVGETRDSDLIINDLACILKDEVKLETNEEKTNKEINNKKDVKELSSLVEEEKENTVALKYFLSPDVWRYNCVINSCKRNGFKESKDISKSQLIWGNHLDAEDYAKLLPNQRVNHFPGSLEVGHKGRLYANLARMKRMFGKEYEFAPESFSLPRDTDSFERAFNAALNSNSEVKKKKDEVDPIWIVKPPNSSCGRGIYLATKLSEVSTDNPCVVSRYIANPLLINKRKFDLRIYVCLVSLLPLKIYLYNDGLARFATKEYSLKPASLKKSYVHLTNFSVNKKSAEFEKNTDASVTDSGFKWSLKSFLKYVKDLNIDPQLIIDRISDVVIKTIISAEANMVSRSLRDGVSANSCFELFGFDILFDDCLHPWIMEVNCFPSLSSSSPMDKKIKTKLVTDIFHLIGIEPFDFNSSSKPIQEDFIPKKNVQIPVANLKQLKNSSLSLTDLYKYFGVNSTTASNLIKAKDINITSVINLLSRCSNADWSMFRKYYAEESRAGNFQLIFPTVNSWEKYGHLFEVHRYSNLLMTLFSKLPKPNIMPLLSSSYPVQYLSSMQPISKHRKSSSSSEVLSAIDEKIVNIPVALPSNISPIVPLSKMFISPKSAVGIKNNGTFGTETISKINHSKSSLVSANSKQKEINIPKVYSENSILKKDSNTIKLNSKISDFKSLVDKSRVLSVNSRPIVVPRVTSAVTASAGTVKKSLDKR